MFTNIQLHILIIAIVTSVACVLPGIFLVLRGVALMSDAISHAILLGIIVSFLLVQNLQSPLLIIGAALAGILTVVCTELLIQTKRLKKDAAIGLVFPLFFSVGVILISQYARNVHLDVDMVLLGEIVFAPFNRLIINGVDCGPHALWVMGTILCINGLLFWLFYKELALATFDQNLARILGFSPVVVYYGLMTMTSITAVGAFDVVGSIVVVALMITPPATAYLLSNQLFSMTIISIVLSIMSSLSGYCMAYVFDVSIAGSIASMTGIFFIITLLFSPNKGILARIFSDKRKKKRLAKEVLCTYIFDNGKYVQDEDAAWYLGWNLFFVKRVIEDAVSEGLLVSESNQLQLTQIGKDWVMRVRN